MITDIKLYRYSLPVPVRHSRTCDSQLDEYYLVFTKAQDTWDIEFIGTRYELISQFIIAMGSFFEDELLDSPLVKSLEDFRSHIIGQLPSAELLDIATLNEMGWKGYSWSDFEYIHVNKKDGFLDFHKEGRKHFGSQLCSEDSLLSLVLESIAIKMDVATPKGSIPVKRCWRGRPKNLDASIFSTSESLRDKCNSISLIAS